ncbi:protein kinase domain containing protein [Entamoeba histolytica]
MFNLHNIHLKGETGVDEKLTTDKGAEEPTSSTQSTKEASSKDEQEVPKETQETKGSDVDSTTGEKQPKDIPTKESQKPEETTSAETTKQQTESQESSTPKVPQGENSEKTKQQQKDHNPSSQGEENQKQDKKQSETQTPSTQGGNQQKEESEKTQENGDNKNNEIPKTQDDAKDKQDEQQNENQKQQESKDKQEKQEDKQEKKDNDSQQKNNNNQQTNNNPEDEKTHEPNKNENKESDTKQSNNDESETDNSTDNDINNQKNIDGTSCVFRIYTSFQTKTTIFKITQSNIRFISLGDGILSNKKEIELQEGEEIKVNEEIRELICIGNDKKEKMKIQISSKEENEKYSIRTNQNIITIEGGYACEFEVFITIKCTTKINDKIMIISKTLNKAQEETIKSISIEGETEISTRLDPDEIKEEKKIGE